MTPLYRTITIKRTPVTCDWYNCTETWNPNIRHIRDSETDEYIHYHVLNHDARP